MYISLSDRLGRRRPVRRTLYTLIRDFYCKCVCDPVVRSIMRVPVSTLKVVLFAILLIVFFVSMAIFDIVGGRRQGHLQHALRERMRHRNFSEETLEWALKHRAAASIFGQYGQRFIDPGRYTGLLNDTIRNIDLKIPTVKDVINKTRGSSVYRALGLDTLRGNVYGSLKRHASKISNHFTRQLKTVRKTL